MSKEIKPLIKEVLENGYLMSLATVDSGGVWVCDLIYLFDDGLNLYWVSNVEARHSDAIFSNPQVACTITLSNSKGEKEVGLQVSGYAEKLEGNDKERRLRHREKMGKSLDVTTLGPNESWYIFRPKEIRLIHEQLFGFEKQKYEENILS